MQNEFTIPPGTKVYIAMPTRGDLDIATHNSIVRTMFMFREAGIGYREHLGGTGVVSRQREEFVHRFLASDCTHLMMVDSDVGWEEATPIRMIASGFDFTGAIYQQRRDGGNMNYMPVFESNGEPSDPTFDERTGFVEVGGVGAGFIILTRNMILEMISAYPDLKYIEEDGTPRYALFLETIISEVRWGEDFAFCKRWQALGGKIWVDPTAKTLHVGRKSWQACMADYLEVEQIAA